MMKAGTVYLIGAGPGDPGLVTVKAVQCLKKADVVVYDYLANDDLLDYAPPHAEKIYAGKMGGAHAMAQEDINKLLGDKALTGATVARLKGGDPYIFGRGGEEAAYLYDLNVPFEVIPGVSSAIAAPAYAGVPLTDRRHTSSVSLITGHEDPTKPKSSLDWERISNSAGTLVFLMGVKNLPGITQNLIKYGRSPETPVAIIQQGTTPSQKTVTGTLLTIVEEAENAGVKPPSIILVGSVVQLRPKLNWFETRPLFGKTIIVTRARQQASGFLQKLRDLGANAIAFPTIATAPPDSWEPLDKALDALNTYQWLIFTSVNGVVFFEQRLHARGLDTRALGGVKVAAIGPATADRLREMGVAADFVPSEYRAEGVVEGLKELTGPGTRMLLPRAAEAREVLPDELRKMGVTVDVTPAYRTILPTERREKVARLLSEGKVDMVTFTSSSTVSNLAAMFPHIPLAQLLKSVQVACIGPITAKTAQKHHLQTHIQPDEYTIEGLTDAIVASARKSTPL